MGWRRRERAPRWLASGKPVDDAPALSADDLEAAVADGMLIARFSAVMDLKNRLIVSALRDDERFTRDRAAAFVRDAVDAVVAEQAQNEAHAEEVIEEAEGSRGAARHEHDYKSRDVDLLDARLHVYRDVARGIREASDDPEWVDALIEDARQKAWGEISRELANRLDDVERVSRVVVDDDYLRDRDERMRRLREFDLWELADQRYSAHPKRGR
ncbi:hypothetical protein [Herbiconiux daphne]|uniref:Asparagine synthase n=1 Tax=Herbiconiux daphne TaxID=2970914 RepID=A0ABT2H191_9MICO|nr:hypothetical protein [Herbiconiux daphne]MCS5733687.1 hypothetical protein [Herbiconiux daphne]